MKTAVRQDTNRQNLIYVANLLNSLGIDWCVFFGTLLGLVRDSDVIKGDDDIDLYVSIESRETLIDSLRREGFEWSEDFPNNSDYFLQIKREVDGEIGLIDLYFTDRAAIKGFVVDRWNFLASPSKPNKFLHVPESLVFPHLIQRTFDCDVRFPAEPVAVIRWLYGETWHTPVSKSTEYYMTVVNNSPVMQMRLSRVIERLIPWKLRPYLQRLTIKLTKS
jgi:hypothetical protein